MQKQHTGELGENMAEEWLRWHDYSIEERNWRSGRLELDIIAKSGNTLVFVEVKTRSSDWFGTPEVAVDRDKQKFMVKAAADYVEKVKHDGPIRFDIISIVLEPHLRKLMHWRDAFFPLSSAGD